MSSGPCASVPERRELRASPGRGFLGRRLQSRRDTSGRAARPCQHSRPAPTPGPAPPRPILSRPAASPRGREPRKLGQGQGVQRGSAGLGAGSGGVAARGHGARGADDQGVCACLGGLWATSGAQGELLALSSGISLEMLGNHMGCRDRPGTGQNQVGHVQSRRPSRCAIALAPECNVQE